MLPIDKIDTVRASRAMQLRFSGSIAMRLHLMIGDTALIIERDVRTPEPASEAGKRNGGDQKTPRASRSRSTCRRSSSELTVSRWIDEVAEEFVALEIPRRSVNFRDRGSAAGA
jgi:hypothetical protein